MGVLDELNGRDDDADVVSALEEAANDQTSDHLNELVLALGQADAFLLSVDGTPLAPNARTARTRDGRIWTVAFSSVARAVRGRRDDDRILRAPMPLVCSVAIKSGQAGIFLNPGDAPWMLIEGAILEAVSRAAVSSRPITMIDPKHLVSLVLEVTEDGTIEADGVERALAELRSDLDALSKRDGVVQYSRAHPRQDPSAEADAVVRSVLDLITELKLPVTFVERTRPRLPDGGSTDQ